jgi:hypothetical protein
LPLFTIAACARDLTAQSVDRFLEDGAPRRYYFSQAILYFGTFLVIAVSAVSVCLPHSLKCCRFSAYV